ncbi:MAG: hypothetical protein ARM1_0546 [Candidatus Micrarchaeota archaeon]|nr:MAG: hypothetical protein ARM1_0546 [Candidatus Micrarchaeota archaeon]
MNQQEQNNYIDFIALHKDWVSIKRLSISDNTKDNEIAFHLAGIYFSIKERIYKLFEIDRDKLDKIANDIVASASKGKKLSKIEKYAESIKQLDNQEIKNKIKEAVKDEKLFEIALAYIASKIADITEFHIFPDQMLLTEIYPELKLPKELTMRMNRAKKKKD